jgi:CubicO group peptidase (beta-lactamase class C family)
MRRSALLLALLAGVLVPTAGRVSVDLRAQVDTPAAVEKSVDAVFGRFTTSTPGCAVGVSTGGRPVLEKGYGMADLEHDVANTGDTIFEAGSVSKQFTAAAVLLLAHDGKLSLDDPVRKYIPELPDYGKPLLIRHMLTHTSGLRDWGEVESIAGWPRTTRVYTHAHVLDIVSRQHALNFEPGTKWSYSNTGYNLAAIIVARVSGKPFAEFCRTRIFQPLGMTHTSWRDEFRRIVKGRAIGYDRSRDSGFLQDMPFENVHGNGGLLTTVGDLLKWNENFTAPKVGDEEFLREEQQPGRFNDGRQHDYAMGLYVRRYKGVPEVGHSGSTAGYRAYLARYPEQHASVAVLCNAGGAATAESYAHAVADLYLGDAVKPKQVPGLNPIANDDVLITDAMKARAGLYRNTVSGAPLAIELAGPRFRLSAGAGTATDVYPDSDFKFTTLNRDRHYDFDKGGTLTVTAPNGTTEAYERVEAVRPTPTQLGAYVGGYWSDDVEVALQVALEAGELTLTRRPDTKLTLRALYKDAFAAPGFGLIRFRRNAQGRVSALSVVLDRVWDMRFERRSAPGT